MTLSQLIALRSASALCVLTLIMNRKAPYYMYNGIPHNQWKSLALRCFLGALGLMCLYSCIKQFPLVLTSLVQNISPLLIALLSYIFLKVGLSKYDMAVLALSFAGVIIIITGSFQQADLIEEGEAISSND